MKRTISRYLMGMITKLYNSISHPYALILTIVIIALWIIAGIPLHFNELWYKALHTFELFVTLILVFIIEITQKVEIKALQEKLDEIIKKHPKTNNKKAGVEKKYKGES